MAKIVGNKIYEVCADCGEIVQINKPLIGSVHICCNNEEIKQNRQQISAKYERNKKYLENIS